MKDFVKYPSNMIDKKYFDVIIIGGGASGMMAGISASLAGKKVCIIEKNKNLGEKLKITGGGRCNITNAEDDIHEYLKHYGKARDFLYSSFAEFSNKDTFAFFESRGLPLVVQARKRAFPHTEKSIDVYKLLESELKKHNVTIKLNTQVRKILFKNREVTGIETTGGTFEAKSYILATGGMSHPETGSTGDGFTFLTNLGHKVKDPTPTIVPIEVADTWVHALAGISLSFMKITFFTDGKKAFSKTGKILFTHFGLSGPLILNSSSMVQDLLYSGKVTAKIDAYPDTDLGALDAKIVKVFDANKNKMLKTVFREIAPFGTSLAILSIISDIDPTTKVHSLTKENRKKIGNLLKSLPLDIIGLMGFDRAVVADGGVDLKEIDTKTMRSKLYDNLYVTGDLLNINRPSGGFSLQISWTSGYIAGLNA